MLGSSFASTTTSKVQTRCSAALCRPSYTLRTYAGFVGRAGHQSLLCGTQQPSLKCAVQKQSRVAPGRRVVTTRAMFERFTEKAIKVVMLAQEEARRLGHNFVGTEQILLGLIGT
jgi:ATP-dependent Clp protease ATP-binding subunit ClpC